VQGATESSGALFGFQIVGLREGRLAQHGDEGVELGVIDLNAREASFGELRGRDGAGPNAR
jgi:hypothetical protein